MRGEPAGHLDAFQARDRIDPHALAGPGDIFLGVLAENLDFVNRRDLIVGFEKHLVGADRGERFPFSDFLCQADAESIFYRFNPSVRFRTDTARFVSNLIPVFDPVQIRHQHDALLRAV